MHITSKVKHGACTTEVKLVVRVRLEQYDAMDRAVRKTARKSLRQVFEQSLLNDLKKANDTLAGVLAVEGELK